MIDIVAGVARESFALFAGMAPYLILGALAAGAIHVLIPIGFVARHLGGNGLASPFWAAVIGVPLPLCSCGVVPVAASLKKDGASDGAMVSFLITTPTSGVDSILATYSLLGGAFAAARTVFSFLIGLAAGVATSLSSGRDPEPERASALASGKEERRSVRSRFKEGMAYGFGELFGGIAGPLTVGTLIGGAISYALPPGVLERYAAPGIVSYLVMLAVGIPLYVCASGSIPVAAALLAKGISPGAALVFLIAGPATNAASLTVVSKMLSKRAVAIYFSTLAVGSIAAGFATDALFFVFPQYLPFASIHAHHGQAGLGAFEIASGSLLGLLVAYHLAKPFFSRFLKKKSGACGGFEIEVGDMNCQNCAAAITNAVSKIEGVLKVDANPDTKKVRLDLGDNVEMNTITKAIEDAGFHPKK